MHIVMAGTTMFGEGDDAAAILRGIGPSKPAAECG